MSPVDITLNAKTYVVNDLVRLLKSKLIEYDYSYDIKSSTIELLILNSIGIKQNILVRIVQGKGKQREDNIHLWDNYYKAYSNHGFIKAIEDYIINDVPLTDMTIFKEYEGLSFSELPISIQRHILERNVCFITDDSIYKSEDEENLLCKLYADMLHNNL